MRGPRFRSKASPAPRRVQLEGYRLQDAVYPMHSPCPGPRGRAREAQSLSAAPHDTPAHCARGHTLQERPTNKIWRRHPERGVLSVPGVPIGCVLHRGAAAGRAGRTARGDAPRAGRRGSAFLRVITQAPPGPGLPDSRSPDGPGAIRVVGLRRLAGPGHGARLPGWMRWR